MSDELKPCCPYCESEELSLHSETDINGAGVQIEYWYTCDKCGEFFSVYDATPEPTITRQGEERTDEQAN